MQVGILTLLFNRSESYPLLLGFFLSEECVQRSWIGGLFVGIGGLFDLAPMDRTLGSKSNDPVDHLTS